MRCRDVMDQAPIVRQQQQARRFGIQASHCMQLVVHSGDRRKVPCSSIIIILGEWSHVPFHAHNILVDVGPTFFIVLAVRGDHVFGFVVE